MICTAGSCFMRMPAKRHERGSPMQTTRCRLDKLSPESKMSSSTVGVATWQWRTHFFTISHYHYACVWHLPNIKFYIFNASMFIAGNRSKKHAERGVFALKASRGYESVWITLQVEYTTKLVAQLSLQPATRQNWRWWLLQDVLDRWPYVVLGGWWALLCTVQGRPHGETPTKCWVSSARPCMTKRLRTAPRRSGWNVPGGCVCTSHPLVYP